MCLPHRVTCIPTIVGARTNLMARPKNFIGGGTGEEGFGSHSTLLIRSSLVASLGDFFVEEGAQPPTPAMDFQSAAGQKSGRPAIS